MCVGRCVLGNTLSPRDPPGPPSLRCGSRSSRLLRAVRLFRYSVSLQKILWSLTAVFWSLIWTFVLAFLLMYVLGLAMMEGVASYVSDAASQPVADLSDQRYSISTSFPVPLSLGLLQELDMYYGSVGRTFATLYRSVSGADWSSFAAPLAKISWFWGLVWACYVGVVLFGMLNVLTGSVVDIVKRPVSGSPLWGCSGDERPRYLAGAST